MLRCAVSEEIEIKRFVRTVDIILILHISPSIRLRKQSNIAIEVRFGLKKIKSTRDYLQEPEVGQGHGQ